MEKNRWKVTAGVLAMCGILLISNSLRAETVREEVSNLQRNSDLLPDRTGLSDYDLLDPKNPTPPDEPDGITDNTEPEPPDPSSVALDAEGNPYPQGGPPGLYNAIIDKQVKTADDGGSGGNTNALSRLRRNLNRWLQKKGLLDDGQEPPTGPEETTDNGAPDSDTSGSRKKAALDAKEVSGTTLKSNGSAKPERPARIDKPARPEKVSKPVRPAKIDRPSKPQKIARPARPEKPYKPHRPNK